jgi:hypothetical protein
VWNSFAPSGEQGCNIAAIGTVIRVTEIEILTYSSENISCGDVHDHTSIAVQLISHLGDVR